MASAPSSPRLDSVRVGTPLCLRIILSFKGEINLPKDYCSTDLDLDADFEILLPRRRGLGLCATALVSYLIRLHNEIVYAVEKLSEGNNRCVHEPTGNGACSAWGP